MPATTCGLGVGLLDHSNNIINIKVNFILRVT